MSHYRQKFFLKDNPFGIVPDPEVKVWADRARLKAQLEALISNMLMSPPSRLVACFWGDWGAGKTHMAYYFSRPELLKAYSSKVGVSEPLSLHLIMPLRDVIDSIYVGVLDRIGLKRIRNAVDKILEHHGITSAEDQIRRLEPIVRDKMLATAFSTSESFLQSYLYQTATSKELKEHRLARGITWTGDKLRALSAVLKLLSAVYSRIILWIDDSERLEQLSGRDLAEFQTFIRDLLDYVPKNLNIILLYTMTPGRKVEDMLSYLGEALQSRMYRTIQVEVLSKEDFFEFVTDLLRQYRTSGAEKKVDAYFPFKDRPTLEYIYDKMKQRDVMLKKRRRSLPLVPRQINNFLSGLLEMALEDAKVKSIDKQLVDRYMSEPSYVF